MFVLTQAAHLQKPICQQQNVLPALPQGWQFNRNHMQPIIQIFSKPAGPNFFLRISISRTDKSYIHPLSDITPNLLEFTGLQKTQHFLLQRQVHLTELI